MAESQFSLSWEAYYKNICNGLSSLQQNGEFVDMTLAADGHFVKVHKIIMALASPFIKELLGSMNCSHPVIFLNKISYTTLSSILEYVYTGEVVVSLENISELVQAGRELHIKGLEDMKLQPNLRPNQRLLSTDAGDSMDDDYCYFEITEPRTEEENKTNVINDNLEVGKYDEEIVEEIYDDTAHTVDVDNTYLISPNQSISEIEDKATVKKTDVANVNVMQYTVSNQGSLQMILNRFVYYLKHTNRDNTRQWRCVDYVSSVKCPAHVVTKDEVVLQRIARHTHPFHDKRILKKIQSGAVFSAIKEADVRQNKVRPQKRKADDQNVDSA